MKTSVNDIISLSHESDIRMCGYDIILSCESNMKMCVNVIIILSSESDMKMCNWINLTCELQLKFIPWKKKMAGILQRKGEIIE